MGKNNHINYRLSFLDKENNICVMAPERNLNELLRSLGTNRKIYLHPKGRYIKLPANRINFMAAESIAPPSFASEQYIEARKRCMSYDSGVIQEFENIKPELNIDLLDHQRDFCIFAQNKDAVLNASEQGTGKTLMAITLARMWNCKRVLVVCPSNLIQQWSSEITKFLKNPPLIFPLDEYPIKERAEFISCCGGYNVNIVCITSYASLTGIEAAVCDWKCDCLILDESWKVKNRNAAVTKSAIRIADKVKKKILMTGTPTAQDVGDYWSQVRIIDGKNIETYAEWIERFANIVNIDANGFKFTKIIGCKDPVGLIQRIEPFYFRATKAVCIDLPDKEPVESIYLDFSPEVRKLYEAVKKDGENIIDELSLAAENVKTVRLQQITGGFLPDIHIKNIKDKPKLVPENYLYVEDDLCKYKIGDELESPKVEWCKQFVKENVVENDHYNIIVWCKFIQEVERIVRELRELVNPNQIIGITGSGIHAKNNKQIEDIKRKFNNRDKNRIRIIVTSIDKMAFGHNLQFGDINVMYSHHWSFIHRDQLEDRSHRIGRVGNVRYIELIIRDSIDEKIIKAIRDRQKLEDRLSPGTTNMDKIKIK